MEKYKSLKNINENIDEAHIFVKNFIKDYPELKDEVIDLYELYEDEVNNGESPDNELRLLISSCNRLLIDNLEDNGMRFKMFKTNSPYGKMNNATLPNIVEELYRLDDIKKNYTIEQIVNSLKNLDVGKDSTFRTGDFYGSTYYVIREK